MSPAANAALAHTVADSTRSIARAATALLPRRPRARVREVGVDRDGEIAPGIDIEQFHRGDSGTFRRVLHRFGPLIKSIAASYTFNLHDREELYQEITVRLWERRTLYSGRGPLGGWINRMAHHFCRNWHKSQAAREAATERHAAEAIALGDADGLLEDPSRLMDRLEFMDRLRFALAQLPPRQEQTFTLIHMEGFSVAETARMLRARRVTVRSNLRHATRKLRELMGDYRA